ncbi:glycosyltransferase family 2 protein [Sideroxydans lithotrophicus]|uniref:Glycosyl transferase family 2 n=1 Tax=Sideroxydans lithotrophicus (strain ES-1) TaxID=580332 RepID=D5CQ95_SIDLE|nr:glycosyltransferase family 2 protein [Sideroxydans lithotrophicus]ADE13116.1 glycosyl transferase family 2 [Sideroxydans lithotrophicus ES-1]
MEKIESSKNKPLISIGIRTYNRPVDLRRTLTEITKQTYTNLDIIVSDNASQGDETENIMCEFMRNDERIRYFKQSANLGINLNFQFVLEKAKGEFFIWSADDDWHSPEFVEYLLAAKLNDDAATISFCDFDIREEDGRTVLDYPDSHAALVTMTCNNSLIRQLRFFMLPEGGAIPHAIYGLLPMRNMKSFSWPEHVQRYGEYGADTLFVFWLLGQGRLALAEKRLFGCTVNNQKHYVSAQKSSIAKKIRTARQRMGYLISFIRIAKGWTRLALLFAFPLKLAEMFFSMTVREPIRRAIRARGER